MILRATTREDMRRQWEFENDPELWFWDGGPPRPSNLEAILAHYDKSLEDGGDEISFAIEVDGKYVGHCSLHGFDNVSRCCELQVEIGDKAYQGKGYGREVVRLLLAYAFNNHNMNRVWLKTHSENERAIRCYLACGFVEEGRMRQHLWIEGHFVDRVFMGILRSDFDQNNPPE